MSTFGLSQKMVTHWANGGCIQQTSSVFSFTELSVNYAMLSAGMAMNLGPQVAQGRVKASPMGRLAISKLASCLWSLLVPWDSGWGQSWMYHFHFVIELC